MSKILCPDCEVEMKVNEAGVVVCETFLDPPRPYKIWMADQMICPGCHRTLVANFGDSPLESRADESVGVLGNIKDIGKATIFYSHENYRAAEKALGGEYSRRSK